MGRRSTCLGGSLISGWTTLESLWPLGTKSDTPTSLCLSKGSDESDEGSARLAEIENLYTKTMAKHARMRQLLANQNLHIASTTRLIDDIPTRTELIQYERRFSELYVQVNHQC